ncbi:hypothetical protein LTR08_003315 [Meristemomyces frigidus]|nr:hypothetical protein LTR08_003315 [Meristemomyces frigidus]
MSIMANGVTKLLQGRLLERYGDYLVCYLKHMRRQAGLKGFPGREALFKDADNAQKP